MKRNCDQCAMLSINGLACHEIGCPKANEFQCVCGEYTSRKYFANDWDGIAYCKECARSQGEFEMNLEE